MEPCPCREILALMAGMVHKALLGRKDQLEIPDLLALLEAL